MLITYSQAKRRAFWHRIWGFLLCLMGMVGITNWCLKFIYEGLRPTSFILLAKLNALIAHGIAWIYNTVPGESLLWAIVPTFYSQMPFNAVNMPILQYVGTSLGLTLVGAGFLQASRNLRKKLAGADDDVQHRQWVDERGGRRPAQVMVNEGMVVNNQINVSSQERWWSRPIGILGLSVLAGVIYTMIVQWLNHHYNLPH